MVKAFREGKRSSGGGAHVLKGLDAGRRMWWLGGGGAWHDKEIGV